MKIKFKNWLAKGTIVALVVVGALVGPNVSQGAALTSLSDNMSRLAENTLSDHDIRFVTPSGVGAGETVEITFSSDFDLAGIVITDIDFAEGNSNNCTTASFTDKALSASPSGATWGAVIAGNVITFTSDTDTITADRCVQVQIGVNAGGSGQIENGPLDDDDMITIAGTFGDTGVIAVDIIADDQVVITATVGPSIAFAISDNTIGFGPLNSAAARYATGSTTGDASPVTAHTLAASTNASGGYVIYMHGPTLTSGLNTITAIGGSNTASAAGTEQFGVRFTASGGSGAVSAPYAASGYAYDAIAAPDQIASAAAATDTTTYNAIYVANVDAFTEAGAYATTLTYTATATF